jgi:MFS transporter, DHA1 family, tetracycline resistance protein
MDKRLVTLCSIIALDGVGIGLIYPILPDLLRALTGSVEVSLLYGAILALYALMQFVFSPLLGFLSDRVGRRPVMIASIMGTTVDYLAMAFAPSVTILVIGRAIAGITSANLSVAMAYVTDITDENARASRMGYLQAAFGIGFFAGPIMSGLLAPISVRLPFVTAAVLNGLTLTLATFALPETRQPVRSKRQHAVVTRRRLGWIVESKTLLSLLAIQALMGIIGNVSSTTWILYGHDRFMWDSTTTAYSLALLGLCHAAAQAGLTGPVTARLGERSTVILGIVCDVAAMVSVGLARRGWIAFALAPVFSLGAIGMPALQSLMTRQVDETRQGELQGILASIASLTAVLGPLVASASYASTKHLWMGGVWVIGAALYGLVLPFLPKTDSANSENTNVDRTTFSFGHD